jgi:hypothetical protein
VPGRGEDSVKKILLTKSLDGAYEEEERVMGDVRGPGIHEYSRDAILLSVIAGMRTEPPYLEQLEAAAAIAAESSLIGLSMCRAIEVPGKFALTVPGHPRLGFETNQDTGK